MAELRKSDLAKSVSIDKLGLYYHENNFNLHNHSEPIQDGDLIYMEYYRYPSVGYLVIASLGFLSNVSHLNGGCIHFRENPNYKGYGNRFEHNRSFARKVISIKGELRPTEEIFCQVEKSQWTDHCTVKAEDGTRYKIDFHGKVNVVEGNAIWGIRTDREIEFGSISMSGYPKLVTRL